MITLPNECLFEILYNLKDYRRSLYSCLLVNRQWCRNVVPILWSELDVFKNKALVKTCLLMLNTEEQALLIPFNIMLPNNSKPLFEYTTYVTDINIDSVDGIINWLYHEKQEFHYSWSTVTKIIKHSLTLMLLRTSVKLKYLSVRGKAVNLLEKILIKSTSLSSLTFSRNELLPEDIKALAKTLCILVFRNVILVM
ncbi:f-box domain-containing protein [Gigaspora margarita]|uniref:F-box domain-containing protein n=1 Tax=Gigaspora margarita TaxID=4874 RepID=A0A8H4ARH9_GIGMA|nr:f-box domain-containing protein [Gigaspora margarita]